SVRPVSSLPTLRSSDLDRARGSILHLPGRLPFGGSGTGDGGRPGEERSRGRQARAAVLRDAALRYRGHSGDPEEGAGQRGNAQRSEENTSELQSRVELV